MSSPPDSDRSLPAPDKTYRKFLPGIRNHRTPSFSPPGTPPSPPSSPPPEISPPAASKSTVPSKPVFKHPGDRISLEDCSDSGNRTDCANRPGLDHIYLKDQIHAWLRTVYKRLETDLDLIFHSTEVEPLCLSLAGSVHDFYRILELFARYPFRTITFSEEEEGKGRIDFEFKMSVTPLHSAVPKWASETFTDMIRGKFRGDDTFFTWEEAGLMVQGSWGSDLPTNLHREDSPEAEEEEEGEGRRTLKKKKMTKKQKKMAEMFKTADHIYCYDENEYPSIVFEVGWSEQMGDLRRDAQQWLCRTNSAKCKNKHDGKQWKHGKEKQHGKSRQRGTKKQCSTTPGVNVVILVKIEECKDPLLVERERKRRAIVEEQDDYPDNVIGDVDKEDLDLLATIEDDKLAGWLSDNADDGWSSGDEHDEQQSSDDEEQQPSDDEDEDMTNDANSLPSTSAAPDTDDDNCMQIDSDMEEYDYRSPSPSPSRSFASNCESTVETFSVAKRKIKTSHWVGSISAVLELWRWDPKRKIPFSSARRIVLPRNNATNDTPMTLSKHEVFPYVRPGEDRHKKFELDMEQLRRRLEKAMHRYAFQRCLQWRRKLLDRRHGKNWRDEYVRDKRAQLGMD